MQGSGVVRAGQWSRRLLLNDSIDKGTQLPYIRKGLANGWGIIVMNPNDNYPLPNDNYLLRLLGTGLLIANYLVTQFLLLGFLQCRLVNSS
ncbi:FAM172A [Bugula neritina]|uniref:FAM172A n=1 Tax=Bugula neritina TaxID=10212 RepID=A0A7J7KKP3_BUGNE|nr:FAM172A [Bugula neritina]